MLNDGLLDDNLDNDNLRVMINIYKNNYLIFCNFYSYICKPCILCSDDIIDKMELSNNYKYLLSKNLNVDKSKIILALTRSNNNLNMSMRYILNY
jgi:hypothetical protein